jgi:hypothetical protein
VGNVVQCTLQCHHSVFVCSNLVRTAEVKFLLRNQMVVMDINFNKELVAWIAVAFVNYFVAHFSKVFPKTAQQVTPAMLFNYVMQ